MEAQDLVSPGLLKDINVALHQTSIRYIVLDDDPTGTQCSNNVYVYTRWDDAEIRELLMDESHPLSFILTNSRSLTERETWNLHTEILERITRLSKILGVSFRILSRSDSTLRWNYPSEMDAIRSGMCAGGIVYGAEVICPCFIEGGRFTKNDIHYVVEDGVYNPIAETDYARDKTFFYHSSNLRDYIREKTGKRMLDDEFVSISEEELTDKSGSVSYKLMHALPTQKIIVNATNYEQLAFFALQYLYACNVGCQLLYRGASSMIRFLNGIPFLPLLKPNEIIKKNGHGGLVVAGSHVQKTTNQIMECLEANLAEPIVFDQHKCLNDDASIQRYIADKAKETDRVLNSGKNVCLMTERKRVDLENATREQQLEFTAKISSLFIETATAVKVVPSFIIAKGGITSCQYGESLMNDHRVLVSGQIASGIPVWKFLDRAKYPEISFVVFPGNVGNDSQLKVMIESLAS